MRSEERSGIIVIALILLWGTLITEPFRYFAEIISDGTGKGVVKLGAASGGKIESLVLSAVIALIAIVLLKLSKLKAGHLIGPVISCAMLAVFLVGCLLRSNIDKARIVVFVVTVVIILVLAILKAEKILIWITDAFILSLPVHLFFAWVLEHLSSLSDKAHKFMFFCKRSNIDLSTPFKGFITVPAIVWGIFFFILTALPVIYFIPGRRKG